MATSSRTTAYEGGCVGGCVCVWGSPGQLEEPTVQERSSAEALTCLSLPP